MALRIVSRGGMPPVKKICPATLNSFAYIVCLTNGEKAMAVK